MGREGSTHARPWRGRGHARRRVQRPRCPHQARDGLRRAQQRGQQGLLHQLGAGAVGLAADVEGRHRLPQAVGERCGDGDQAFFQLLVHQAPALRARLANALQQGGQVGGGVGGVALQGQGGQAALQLVVGQAGQQHAAHGSPGCRQARAHAQAGAHDLVGGHAQHVDDVQAIEHGGRGRFAHLLHQVFHQRLGQVPQRQRRQVGKAQVEDARREAKELAVTFHITQRLQREQDAARPGAGQAGVRRHLAQGLLGCAGAEGADHFQPTRERLHIAVARLGGGGGRGQARGGVVVFRRCHRDFSIIHYTNKSSIYEQISGFAGCGFGFVFWPIPEVLFCGDTVS